MLREGEHMIAAHPLTGVGPNMVAAALRASTAIRDAVEQGQPAPAQRAAADRRRARPAGARRLALVHRRARAATCGGASRPAGSGCSPPRRSRRSPAMLAAGLFEYNFGDSEFLMLFLVLVTLPFAADAPTPSTRAA